MEKFAIFGLAACLALAAPVGLLGLPPAARAYHAAPTGLSVTGTTPDSVSLDWNDYTAFPLRGYRLSRYTSSGTLIDRRIIGTTSVHTWTALQPSTTYLFAVQAVRPDGHLSQRSPRVTARIAAASLSCPDGEYQARYWSSVDLTGTPALIRCESAVDDDWRGGGPPGLPVDNFSARYDGKINLQAGSYEFRVTADDGVRLWVDGTLLIDKWVDQAATTYTSARTMTAGLHDVRVEYYERGGVAVIRLNTVQIPAPQPSTRRPGWLGNTWSGKGFTHIPHVADDIAVAPNGVVATNSDWEESGREISILKDTNGDGKGERFGPHTQVHQPGSFCCGGQSVAIDANYIYVGIVNTSLRRYLRSDMETRRGCCHNGNGTFAVGGEVRGLAVDGGEIFAAVDPAGSDSSASDSTVIKVYDASTFSSTPLRQFSAPRVRSLAVDRQGALWGVRQNGSGGEVVRISRTNGSVLATITGLGQPMDVAADPSGDRIAVADNGLNRQTVRFFDLSGNQIGTLGTPGGYLAGPIKGEVGPRRFTGPRGVGIDSAGNVYVAQSGGTGAGTGAWPHHRFLRVEAYRPDQSLLWKAEGLHFTGIGEADTASCVGLRCDFHSRELQYTVDYSTNPVTWELEGFTIAADEFPNDPRINKGAAGHQEGNDVYVRRLGGTRWMFQPAWQQSQQGGPIWIYRLRDGAYVAEFVRQLTGSDNRLWFPDSNGDLWMTRNGSNVIDKRPLQDAATATYGSTQQFTLSDFERVRQVVYIPATDTMYAMGFRPGVNWQGEADWKSNGRTIARYDNWSTTRTRRWIIDLPDYQNSTLVKSYGFAVIGDYVVVSWFRDPLVSEGTERAYNANTGAHAFDVRDAFWDPIDEQPGWNDSFAPHLQRIGSTYVMSNQENHRAKIKLALWVG